MADIQKELGEIKTALYGKDVRGSIYNGLDAINSEVNNLNNTVIQSENIINTAKTDIGNFKTETTEGINTFENNVKTQMNNHVESVKTTLDKNNKKSQDDFNSFKESVNTDIDTFKTNTNNDIRNFENTVSTELNGFKTDFSSLKTNQENEFNQLKTNQESSIDNLNKTKTEMDSAVQNANTSIDNANKLAQTAKGVIDGTVGAKVDTIGKNLVTTNLNVNQNTTNIKNNNKNIQSLESEVNTIKNLQSKANFLPITGGTITGDLNVTDKYKVNNCNALSYDTKNQVVTVGDSKNLFGVNLIGSVLASWDGTDKSSIRLDGDTILINGAPCFTLDSNNNIQINSGNNTSDGKALGETHIIGNLLASNDGTENNSIELAGSNFKINGARGIYLDPNNNIRINSGDKTADGKYLGETHIIGSLLESNDGTENNSVHLVGDIIKINGKKVLWQNGTWLTVGQDTSTSLLLNGNVTTSSIFTVGNGTGGSVYSNSSVVWNDNNAGVLQIDPNKSYSQITVQGHNILTATQSLMALGHTTTNLMITNYKNETKDKQLGHATTNLMIENMKMKKDLETLKEQNKTLAKIIVNQQIKNK